MDKIQYWVDIAEYDIETASAMLQTKRYLYVGFMCHQAIEKLLKAHYIHSQEKNAPRTHNLNLLAKESGIYDDLTVDQKDFLDILGPLNIEARYPTNKERIMTSLNFERCNEILNRTVEMMKWIKTKLSL